MKKIVIKEHTLIEDFLVGKKINIIDLGACRGEFTSEINNNYDVNMAILVEPCITNFKRLPFSDNFKNLNRAIVGDGRERVIFNEDFSSPYNGSLVFNDFQNIGKYEIPTIRLKELIDIINTDDLIDVLKIDIEGTEYELFDKLEDDLLLKFKQITVEFHDFLDKEYSPLNLKIEKRMIDLGFCVEKNGIEYLQGSDYYDTLFYKI